LDGIVKLTFPNQFESSWWALFQQYPARTTFIHRADSSTKCNFD